MSTEPAAFGTQAARTMYAAFYGDLARHSWPDAVTEAAQDAYSLFYARSAAMGWLTGAEEDACGGIWGMNDAEAALGSGPPPARAAYFQVVLTGPTPGGLLPAQAFLSCAGDVLARLGTLRLDAVQVLLPEPAAGRHAVQAEVALLEAGGWFAESDRASRPRLRVTLDAGPDPAIRSIAPAIVASVRAIDQDAFVCDSFSLARADHLALSPVPFDGGRPGAARVTLRGTLVEWSPEALGWLAALLAEVCARHGVRTPLMLTADRSAAGGC